MDETHLSVFHSISNRAHGKFSRNSISSTVKVYAFNSFFYVSRALVKRLYDIHFSVSVVRQRDAYEIVDVARTDTKQDVVAQQNL